MKRKNKIILLIIFIFTIFITIVAMKYDYTHVIKEYHLKYKELLQMCQKLWMDAEEDITIQNTNL